MIATIRGIALSPGVSRNGRLYTAETIARAVARAQQRIADGTRPVSMRTHHAAGDDSTRLTGHLTEMTLDADGKARFAGGIEGTDAGRSIATLADDRGGPPTLRGLSIRGAWLGSIKHVVVDGQQCETADDLEITGLDWTAEPGVDDAGVEQITFVDDAGTAESAVERHPITESAEEASVTITEQTTTAPAPVTIPAGAQVPVVPGVSTSTNRPIAAPAQAAPPVAEASLWADLGFNGKRRWPLDTRAQARAAWVGLAEADGYTAPQVKRMKVRIKSALTRHGVQLTEEGWLIDPPTAVTEATSASVAEGYGYCDDEGSFYVTVSSGRLSVSVSSYCVEPDALDTVARAAMDGACKALAGMSADSGGAIETTPTAAPVVETAPAPESVTPAAAAAPQTPAAVPAAGTAATLEEAAVSEPETPAATTTAAPATAPSITLTGEQFGQFLDRIAPPAPPAAVPAAAPAETAPAAAAAETAPAATTTEAAPAAAVVETEAARIDRLVAERVNAAVTAARTEIIQEVAKAFPPARRGLVESGAAAAAATAGAAPGLPESLPQQPLHTYNDDQKGALDRYIASAILPSRALTAES